MKKILLAITSLIIALSSCKKETPLTEEVKKSENLKTSALRLAGNENVKLFKARTVAAYYSRSYIREKSFQVEVKNLAFNKQVSIHHKMSDGSWKDFPLSYVTKGENNAEIWGWDVNYGVGTPASATFGSVAFADEFVVKYDVNGQTYWDNNFGKNYNISSPLITDGMFLQNGLNVNADTYHSTFSATATTNNLQIQADVRNLNYNKEVTLVYTTNNWATVNYANFNFANTYGFGGANLFLTPNQKDFEKWTVFATISPSVSQVKYALRYRVNGQEYWDNNFGANYTINKL